MYKLAILAFVLGVVYCKDFTLVNNHGVTIWVRTLGNAGLPAPGGGTIELGAGEQKTITADKGWAGRFWASTGCSGNACDPGPNTLAEFNIGDLDFYDVSLVDGFNVAILVEPLGVSVDPNNPYRCGVAGCRNNLLPGCPSELRELNSAGQLVVCKSACAVYATDEYCCGGAHGTPATCNPSTWAVNSAAYFKANCPGAYSYAYDDQASTYTCSANAYRITFT